MEAVRLLAGGISHDFNNLLSVILGNSKLFLEPHIPGFRDFMRRNREANILAAQLTRQLLAFSPKQLLYPTILNLNTVVSDSARSCGA